MRLIPVVLLSHLLGLALGPISSVAQALRDSDQFGTRPPANGPWDPALVRMEKRELAPGVFAVFPSDLEQRDHVATTAGFVVGARGVFLIETLVNAELTQQLLAHVRSVSDASIRYVANTSYHGDHHYGNFLLPATTTIIQHPWTKAFLDEKFEDDRRFMLELLGRERGIEAVRYRAADLLVRDQLVIDLGGIEVHVLHLGFGQTAGDLIVWVPSAKVAWVGNMVHTPPALPWQLDGKARETAQTLRRLQDFLPRDAIVIAGHGRPVTPADLDFPIRYLETLDARVREAVADGLTLEETIARLPMKEFAAYSLYPLAHFKINLPAAYREAMQVKKQATSP
jgi:cyclase